MTDDARELVRRMVRILRREYGSKGDFAFVAKKWTEEAEKAISEWDRVAVKSTADSETEA